MVAVSGEYEDSALASRLGIITGRSEGLYMLAYALGLSVELTTCSDSGYCVCGIIGIGRRGGETSGREGDGV